MSFLSKFSRTFDNPIAGIKSIDRMVKHAGTRGFTLKDIFTSPFKAAAAIGNALLSPFEYIGGYMAETALGVQRALTEVPTGALFEGARRTNAVTSKIWFAPSGVIGGIRGWLKGVYEDAPKDDKA